MGPVLVNSAIGPLAQTETYFRGFHADTAPRSVLFMAYAQADNAADAVRDAALRLAPRAAQPALLLDLTTPGNRHHRAFADTGCLDAPRPVFRNPLPDSAVLHFSRVRGENLFVSWVTPDPSAFSDTTWHLTGREGLPRLHGLFATIVIAGPELALSDGSLSLAPAVDGVVLVVRSGVTQLAEARLMRDRVLRAGGQILGTVLTHYHDHAARAVA